MLLLPKFSFSNSACYRILLSLCHGENLFYFRYHVNLICSDYLKSRRILSFIPFSFVNCVYSKRRKFNSCFIVFLPLFIQPGQNHLLSVFCLEYLLYYISLFNLASNPFFTGLIIRYVVPRIFGSSMQVLKKWPLNFVLLEN